MTHVHRGGWVKAQAQCRIASHQERRQAKSEAPAKASSPSWMARSRRFPRSLDNYNVNHKKRKSFAAFRETLPVYAWKKSILDAVAYNRVVVLDGV